MLQLPPDFLKEEVRCGFTVTAQRKRIWAAQLEMLQLFDEICRKHNLRYFAEFGTLLGAVRHQGFIPWDDDLDVAMFRPDYERMKEILPEEIKDPYFFQNAYTDSILFAFSKIRDSRTSAIEKKYCDETCPHQGIFIDIFPLDGRWVDDGSNVEMIEKEIWGTLVNPELMEKIVQTPDYPSALTKDILAALLQMSPRDRMRQFEGFLAGQFEGTEKLELITTAFWGPARRLQKSWYEELVYLPFEHLQIPAPAGYHQILTQKYRDYEVFRPGGGGHQGILMDPDKSYTEYYREWGLIKE